jgi:pimeloyl-ACP methyl ester carboxylesterase
LKFLPIDTLPNVVLENVERVTKIAQEQLCFYDNIYLAGHSMGGAIAALAAHEINKIAEGSVKGVVLIGTQTDGLQVLKEIRVPILFYHGKEDEYFPTWQIESIYTNYPGPKMMVALEGLDHDLGVQGHSKSNGCSHDLARDFIAEFSNFFFSLNHDTYLEAPKEIISRKVTLTPKSGLFQRIGAFFSKMLGQKDKLNPLLS